MAAHRTLPDCICESCGASFRMKANTTGRFCSRSCWRSAAEQSALRQCQVCGSGYRPRNAGQRACSVLCGNVLKQSPDRLSPCAYCGGVGEVKPGGRFCSRSCAMYSRTEHGGGSAPLGTRRPQGGYVLIKTENGWEFEHRLVMAETLGRPLLPWPQEHVHHRDGNRKNNDPSNLSLRTGATHGPGATNHCPTCTCDVSDDC